MYNADLSEFTEIFLSNLTSMLQKNKSLYEQITLNFVIKNLRKTIVKSSKLRNKYLCEKMNESKSLHNKQRNHCVSILHKNMRGYFGNLNNKIFTDNIQFWKTISPLFSEKVFHRECITLKESNKTITNNEELPETFNTFFSKIVPNLNVDKNLVDSTNNPNITDPVSCATQKYENYTSILKIKEMMGKNNL